MSYCCLAELVPWNCSAPGSLALDREEDLLVYFPWKVLSFLSGSWLLVPHSSSVLASACRQLAVQGTRAAVCWMTLLRIVLV